jgi:hypothetical protein
MAEVTQVLTDLAARAISLMLMRVCVVCFFPASNTVHACLRVHL